MKNEADIIVNLRQAANVGDDILDVLTKLSEALAESHEMVNTAIVIRRTRNYLELLETNARMSEAFQSIMTMAMEEGMFDPPPKGTIKH